MKTIGIIGAGNLGTHLSRLFYMNQIHEFVTISDLDITKAQTIAEKYGFHHSNTY